MESFAANSGWVNAPSKGGGRLPDCVVQISRAVADSAVKLGRDKTRLPLHERRVVLPDAEEDFLVGLVERENVDEHDRRDIEADLPLDRESGIKWGSSDMVGSFPYGAIVSIWCCIHLALLTI